MGEGGCFICGGKHWASECPQNALKNGGFLPKAGEQGRHLEEEMRLCCMRECARIPGETRTRCPTVPVGVGPKSEEKHQHTKVRPDEQNESDGEMSAPGYSTASGAFEIPKGSVKMVNVLLDPMDGRTEEPESTEKKKGTRRGSKSKKTVLSEKRTSVYNKYEVLREEMEEENERDGQDTFWINLSGDESEEEIVSH